MATSKVAKGDRAALLKMLHECQESYDTEEAHVDADRALLDFIGDDEITAAYDEVGKWYA